MTAERARIKREARAYLRYHMERAQRRGDAESIGWFAGRVFRLGEELSCG